MLDWLRQHKDNPYPNDDEKAMLIKQTGSTINQIKKNVSYYARFNKVN
jgi:hypothetical protein